MSSGKRSDRISGMLWDFSLGIPGMNSQAEINVCHKMSAGEVLCPLKAVATCFYTIRCSHNLVRMIMDRNCDTTRMDARTKKNHEMLQTCSQLAGNAAFVRLTCKMLVG